MSTQPINAIEAEMSTDSLGRPKAKITINDSPQLKTIQWFHAVVLMILIPSFGLVVAIALAMRYGISLMEIGLLFSMYVLTSCGITVGYHRLFSHHAFKTNIACQVILGILGSMACQGPLIYWVSSHRRHHQYSDLPGDPHSPYLHKEQSLNSFHGLWHSHMGWTFSHGITNTFLFAKDLLQNPIISKVNQLYYVWVLLGLAIPTLLGGVITWTWMGALKGFLWGGLVRLFLVHHSSWTIGSISHICGDRPFETKDQSRNNIWLAIPTMGESWHNNHHAFPNSAFHGLESWQIDLSGWVIRLLNKIGLAWDVKVPTKLMMEAKKRNIAMG